MKRRTVTSLLMWCLRRKLDVLYDWPGLQLAVCNAYLYLELSSNEWSSTKNIMSSKRNDRCVK